MSVVHMGAALPKRAYRMLTASKRVWPDIVIIGAMKSGTTTLFNYLRSHQDVSDSHGGEELHYFDLRPRGGARRYRSYFPTQRKRAAHRRRTGRNLLSCESTTLYMFHPEAPKRVREAIPDVKILAILRNPVRRAFSHYQHNRRKGRERLSFEQAILLEPERIRMCREYYTGDERVLREALISYCGRGLYAEQLEKWYEQFDPEQITVIQSEVLFEDPAETMAGLTDFLGLSPFRENGVNSLQEIYNRGSYDDRMDAKVARRLLQYFAGPNEKLFDLLGPEWRERARRRGWPTSEDL